MKNHLCVAFVFFLNLIKPRTVNCACANPLPLLILMPSRVSEERPGLSMAVAMNGKLNATHCLITARGSFLDVLNCQSDQTQPGSPLSLQESSRMRDPGNEVAHAQIQGNF